MKKIFILATAALLLMAACTTKRDSIPEETAAPVLKLNFSVTLDVATKAVKTAVEEGDRIYVFFDSDIPARDQYLTLTYTDGAWDGSWNGGLENAVAQKASGTLSAIYIPFAEATEISVHPLDNSPESIARGTAWYINPTNGGSAVYSYFRSCTGTSYRVADNTVTANLHLVGPAGYEFVHFFVPGLTSVDGRYTLKTEPEIKGATVVAYKPGQGFIVEESDLLPGYAYGGSVCFSGFVPANLSGRQADYKFTLYDGGLLPEDSADDNLFTYSVTGKTLAAKSAVSLPETYRWKSHFYGDDATLQAIPMCELDGQVLYFANINLGATSLVDRPGCYGNKYQWAGTEAFPYDFQEPDVIHDAPYYRWESINRQGCTKYVMYKEMAFNQDESYIDNKYVLDPEDDAATVTLGAPWRTPTTVELAALVEKCAWWYDEPNKGWRVSGRGPYHGNVIFIPLTGTGREIDFNTAMYMASSYGDKWGQYMEDAEAGYLDLLGATEFNEAEYSIGYGGRGPWESVRPVRTSPM